MAGNATILQVTPDGERALVDARLREMDSHLLYLTFTMAADRYAQAVAEGISLSLVDVMEAAATDAAQL